VRRHTVVTDEAVTLGHLFANIPTDAARRTIGPAPRPGQRWVIEASQLALIARDHALGWTPLAPDERTVLERPGRRLSREDVAEALSAELVGMGVPAGLDPELTDFVPPVLPADAPEPQLLFEGLRFDAATRRFAGTLMVVADGMPPSRHTLAGRLVATRLAVVATRDLRADSAIGPGDVVLRRMAADRLGPSVADDPRSLIGGRARRALSADRPIALTDIAPSLAFRRDSGVLLVHEVAGLSIRAQGRALEDAVAGALVSVLSLATGTVVLAEATGPGTARPLGPQGGGSQPRPSRPTPGMSTAASQQ
jgi:flagella basal body P-ring formation protein FlgA